MLYKSKNNYIHLKQIKFDKKNKYFRFDFNNDQDEKIFEAKNRIFLCLQKEIIYDKYLAIKVLYQNKVGWVNEEEFEKL